MSEHSTADVRELFGAALSEPTGLREQFLRNACGTNAALFAEVQHLLELYCRVTDPEGNPPREPPSHSPGTRFGAYETIRLLGSGGMGEVYLGRRADGAFRLEVAVKLINPERSAPDLVSRFQQERGILATLRHRNICSLLDAGQSEDGRLFLVMEYVDGVPITTYCERRDFPIKARVRLLLSVCDAVSYAHRALVVHRDLKPGTSWSKPEARQSYSTSASRSC